MMNLSDNMCFIIHFALIQGLSVNPCSGYTSSGLECPEISLANGKVCYKREWIMCDSGVAKEVRTANFQCGDDFYLRGPNTTDCKQICRPYKCRWVWMSTPPVCEPRCKTTNTAGAVTNTILSKNINTSGNDQTKDNSSMSITGATDKSPLTALSEAANVETVTYNLTENTLRSMDAEFVNITSWPGSIVWTDALVIILCVTLSGFIILAACVAQIYRKTKESKLSHRKTSTYISFDTGQTELDMPAAKNETSKDFNAVEGIQKSENNVSGEQNKDQPNEALDTSAKNDVFEVHAALSDAAPSKSVKTETFSERLSDDQNHNVNDAKDTVNKLNNKISIDNHDWRDCGYSSYGNSGEKYADQGNTEWCGHWSCPNEYSSSTQSSSTYKQQTSCTDYPEELSQMYSRTANGNPYFSGESQVGTNGQEFPQGGFKSRTAFPENKSRQVYNQMEHANQYGYNELENASSTIGYRYPSVKGRAYGRSLKCTAV